MLCHPRFVSIANVLAPHHGVWLERSHGLEHFEFFILYDSRASSGRRFHRQERNDLEQVIFDDVP